LSSSTITCLAIKRASFQNIRSNPESLSQASPGVKEFATVAGPYRYYLVFALSGLLAPQWPGLTVAQQKSRYRDQCHNATIFQTIDAVQDQIVERYDANLDLADKLMGPLDEWLTSRLITDWREQVWKNATHLIRSQADTDRQLVLLEVERRSMERARSILGESGIAGLLDLF
jgi:hypothetical protein